MVFDKFHVARETFARLAQSTPDPHDPAIAAEQIRQISASVSFLTAYTCIIAGLIFVFCLINIAKKVQYYRIQRAYALKQALPSARLGRFWRRLELLVSRDISPKSTHRFTGSWSIMKIGLVLVAFTFNVAFSLAIAATPRANPTKISQIINIANRAGFMAVANLPFMFLLPGRNSPLQIVTGLSYHAFRMPHRVLGIITAIEAIIHSFMWIFFMSTDASNFLSVQIPRFSFSYGYVAVTGMFLLLVFSSRFLRIYMYELFLHMHVLGAFFVILGLWYHVIYVRPYVIAAIAFWTLEYACRIYRRIFMFRDNKGGGLIARGVYSNAHIALSSGALVLRVPVPSHAIWQAGQHAYLSFVGLGAFAQSHPFSIANTSDSALIRGFDADAQGARKLPCAYKNMLFIVKQKKGLTRWLAKQAAKTLDHTVTLPVSLDLAYGHAVDTDIYDRLVLCSVGSGITHTLAILSDIVAPKMRDIPHPSTRPSVRFLAVVRHLEDLNWFGSPLLSITKSADKYDLDVQIHLYVVNGGTNRPAPSSLDCIKEMPIPDDLEAAAVSSTLSDGSSDNDEDGSLEIPAEDIFDTYFEEDEKEVEHAPKTVRVSHSFCATSGIDCRRGISRRHTHRLSPTAKYLTSGARSPRIRMASGRPDASAFLCDSVKLFAGRTLISVCGPEPFSEELKVQAYHLSSDYDLTLDVSSFTS